MVLSGVHSFKKSKKKQNQKPLVEKASTSGCLIKALRHDE